MPNQDYFLDKVARRQSEHTLTGNAQSTAQDWYGGPITLQVAGNKGGGTLVAQVSLDGGTTWSDLHTFGAETLKILDWVSPCLIRASLSGATTPNVTMHVK